MLVTPMSDEVSATLRRRARCLAIEGKPVDAEWMLVAAETIEAMSAALAEIHGETAVDRALGATA